MQFRNASASAKPNKDGCAGGSSGDTIQPFISRCKKNGLTQSQQHRSDMLHLCKDIYGKESDTYREFSTNQDSVPPLPEQWKP